MALTRHERALSCLELFQGFVLAFVTRQGCGLLTTLHEERLVSFYWFISRCLVVLATQRLDRTCERITLAKGPLLGSRRVKKRLLRVGRDLPGRDVH